MQTQHDDGPRGPRRPDLAAPMVEHRPDPSVSLADDDVVAGPQRAIFHQECRQGTPRPVQLPLDYRPGGRTLGIGAQILHFCDQQYRLQQTVEPYLLSRRHRDADYVSPPILWHQTEIGKMLLDAIHIGALDVNLVQRHDHGNSGRPHVIDSLDRLRHHPVIDGHYQYGDIGHAGPTSTHGRESFVPRRIEEGDSLPVFLDLIGTDSLSDAPRLSCNHVSLAYRI